MAKVSPETCVVQAGEAVDEVTGAVVPPLHTATTFARDENYEPREGGFIYSRHAAPTIQKAEEIIAELEQAKRAILFASGLAAGAAVLSLVPRGSHLVAPKVMYFAMLEWIKHQNRQGFFELDLYDADEPQSLLDAIRPGHTSLVWVETPANPTWSMVDIAWVADLARKAGARLLVDSTCASPVSSNPLNLGADFVFHSATKYLNGHSDLTAGAIAGLDLEAMERIAWCREHTGGVLGSFEAWLLIRGMRTLFLRFERQSRSALHLAQKLEAHPMLRRVLYPGLPSHPQHDIAQKQMLKGFGGMMSVEVKGGFLPAKELAKSTELFLPATSLGGVESLIEHRKTIEGENSPISEGIVRISIGIEDPEDLLADLWQALDRAQKAFQAA